MKIDIEQENLPYTKSWDIVEKLLGMNEHTLDSKLQKYARLWRKLHDDAAQPAE